jgi:hypothetical protein
MTIDPNEAAASLDAIATVEQRTRERLIYDGSSSRLMLWGALVAGAYLFTYLWPDQSLFAWIAITIAGFAGSFIILHRDPRRSRRLGILLTYAQVVLLCYGCVIVILLWPLTGRQLSAFWPTLVMLGFVLAGVFLGRFYIYCGVIATAMTIVGYFRAGEWYPLWMALTYGCMLVAAGLWLRRAD